MDIEKLCKESREIILEAGAFIHQELGKVKQQQIEEKDLNSLVSYVDKETEKKLVDRLGKLLPASTFLTEEETVEQREGQYKWIIDPLDGTTNFLHQLPCFAISVALQKDAKTIMGIVYEVNRKECFYAWQNSNAFLNGEKIQVSDTPTLAGALLATGFPYFNYSLLSAYLKAFSYFMQHSRGIRRWGAAAVDLAYVACGRFDAFFEYSLNPWDVAAGAFIVERAGGKVFDFMGSDNYLFGAEIIATNGKIDMEILPIVRDSFYPPIASREANLQ